MSWDVTIPRIVARCRVNGRVITKTKGRETSRRYNDFAKAFFNRKSAKTKCMVAHAAFAHKLARASYYIMRDGVKFDLCGDGGVYVPVPMVI